MKVLRREVLVALLLLGAAWLGLELWIASKGDLVELAARAEKLGFGAELAPLRGDASLFAERISPSLADPPLRASALATVERLVEEHTRIEPCANGDRGAYFWSRIAEENFAEELRVHHDSLDREALRRFLDAFDALEAGTCGQACTAWGKAVARDAIAKTEIADPVRERSFADDAERAFRLFFAERVLVAPKGAVLPEIRRLLRLASDRGGPRVIRATMSGLDIRLALILIGLALPAIAPEERRLVAEELRALGERRRLGLSQSARDAASMVALHASVGTAQPPWYATLRRVEHRRTRAATCEAELQRLAYFVPVRTLDELVANAQRVRDPQPLSGWFTADFELTSEMRVHIEVLSAELLGRPWPRDYFDPAGGPMRVWEEHGVRRGARARKPSGGDWDWPLRGMR